MMKRNLVCVIVLLMLSVVAGASPLIDDICLDGDSVTTQPARATLSIRTSLEGVRVYVDTLAMGTAPLESVSIDTGQHILHYVHPDGNRWLYPAVTETLFVHPSEHIERTASFQKLYSVTSEPYGATIQWNDSILGQTPLRIPLPSSNSMITITKDGFHAETIPLVSDVHEVHVALHPLEGEMGPSASLYLSHEQSKSSMPLYLATGATVLTGAAAAYFKIKADNSYRDYLRNGGQPSLDQVHKFDTLSGVSLAICEVNLLVLTYFLLSR